LLFYIASFLSITSGLILFGLGVYGLLGNDYTKLHVVTELLKPMGFSPVLDQLYLGFLSVLGFWLTLGAFVRIPAAMALGMIIGKLLLVGDMLKIDSLLSLALVLIFYAGLVRIITNTSHDKHDRITPYVFKFW